MIKKVFLTIAILLIASAGCRPVVPIDRASGNTIEPGTGTVDIRHLATSTIPGLQNDTGEFSIYLVKEEISSDMILEADLDQLELEEMPILSLADISSAVRSKLIRNKDRYPIGYMPISSD